MSTTVATTIPTHAGPAPARPPAPTGLFLAAAHDDYGNKGDSADCEGQGDGQGGWAAALKNAGGKGGHDESCVVVLRRGRRESVDSGRWLEYEFVIQLMQVRLWRGL